MTSTAVRVALRIRPLTTKEQCNNATECLAIIPNEPQVMIGDKSFTYDYIFDTESTQSSVYSSAIAPLLQKFVDGFNATVLAYGQTGAGKTFSMGTGGIDNTKDKENQGIVPRCMLELFQVLQERTDNEDGYSYQVLVSFLELHNEDLIDLLNAPTMQKRRSYNGQAPHQLSEVSIREDIAGNIYWTGVKEERCHSPEDLLNFLDKGSSCRTTGSTDMNTVSSRSHAMFTVTLKQQCLEQQGDSMVPKCLNSKFHFVDLAGSERLKRTNAEGDRAKEGIAINAGLLALGNVISALGDESRKSAHVPYRDSKLTRLLQDSLGGNSQTLMIACVSPSDTNFGETLNTLRYANRARNIKNRVSMNQDFTDGSIEINQLRSLVARLRMDISTLRSNGIVLPTTTSFENDESRMLRNEIASLRERLSILADDVLEISTERDTLLMERETTACTTGTQPSATDDDAHDNDNGNNQHHAITITPNPLVANYLKSIQELNSDLAEAKARIDYLENSKPPPQQQLQQISPSTDNHHPQRRRKSGFSGHSKRRYGRPGRISANNSSTTATNPSLPTAPASKQNGRARKRRSQPPPTTKGPSLPHSSAEKNHHRRSSDNDITYYHEDDDEGYVNDVQDENMRNEFKESIAKARADIRKGMEFLELIKPGDEDDWEMWDKELKILMKNQSMERETSDEGLFSASPSPTQLEESDMSLPQWLADSDNASFINQLSADSLVDMDIKQQSPKLVRMLHQIQSDIKVKEELVCHLEKSETEYMLMRRKFDDKINRLQDQLAELQENRDVALKRTKGLFKHSSGGPPLDATHQQQQAREKQQLLEIRQAYETKMKHLLTEIQDLKRKYSQTTNAMHVARNQNESLLKSLRVSVDTLKAEKKQMVKRMKEESDRVRDQITHQERRIQQLQRQHSEATLARRRLERERDLQKQTLKKRNEEVIMNNSQLKQLTCIMKKAVREGGVLDERLLGKISHIIGGNFAILSHGSLGFPLRGGGHTRSNNARRSNKQVSSIPLQVRVSRKKTLLDKALGQYVQGKQAVVEMEQILMRRERLSDEKQDLMDERRHIYLMEKERTDDTGEPMDMAAIDFMDERIDLVSTEISYLSSRIHGLQMEAAASDANNPQHHYQLQHHRLEKHVTFADEIVTDPPPSDEWADMDAFEEQFSVPSNAAPDLAYDITFKLLKSLKADECKKVSEAMLKDIMDLRMAECNRHITMQNLERSVTDMRRTLIVMKRAAVASTVENERRIRRLEGTRSASVEEMDPEAVAAMDRKMEDYISNGNTIFDKIYEDGLRGMISDDSAPGSPLDYNDDHEDDGSVLDPSGSSLYGPGLLVADDSCSDALLTPSSFIQTPTATTTPAGNWSGESMITAPQPDSQQQQRLPSTFSFSETTESAIMGTPTACRVDTTPSPDRFYNMIHKRLASPLSQDDGLPTGMINPLELRRVTLDQTPTTELDDDHHHHHQDLGDDSSTSSIRSIHVRQAQPIELPPTPTVPTEKEFNRPILGMTTPATTPATTPNPPLATKTKQHSLELRSSSAMEGKNVFNRLASASTRASRAKVHRLSY